MIRHRLVAAVMAAVTTVMALTGVVVVRVLEYRLVGVIDQQLVAFASQQPPVPGSREHGGNGTTGRRPAGSHMTIVQVGPKGEVRTQVPAGPDPGALPDLAGLTAPFAPRTLPPASGDGPGYRAVAIALPDGGMVVAAIPLGDVEAAVAETRHILLAAGASALLLVVATVWLSIRRGLRPIDGMVGAAERIAAGDLTARASAPNPATEVGQLGSALNAMLDRIQQAMAAKAESEQRMRRFVADASHELRTPLTSIRGYAELHRQGATSPEEVARGMARIEREAEHMAALVEDLLLLARLDQARPMADELVDLTRTVEEAVADAQAADPQRRIAPKLPGHPVVVRGDRPRLRQVLDNLLANVRDHTNPGTTATVILADPDDAATLSVSDDGPGMRPDEAARAFERFWQADPTPAHPRQGAGLGLAIAAELVAAHRGTITLDTAPGAGTSFTITLPLAHHPTAPDR